MTALRSLIPLLLLCAFACADPPVSRTVLRSFYFWKGNFRWGDYEQDACEQWKINQLYIRFFEIRPGPAGLPAVEARAGGDWKKVPEAIQIVPTVFILQQVFRGIPDSSNIALAWQTAGKIQELTAGRIVHEVQIDCDWTKSTRDAYFAFLKYLKQAMPDKRVSVTIRLHQVKYRAETGIPPADRGMLMVYNLSDPTRINTQNSIFDRREASKYLNDQAVYPLPLDVALPLFAWGVHFRNGKFQGFLHELNRESVKKIAFMTPDQAKNMYKITADTVFRDTYLRPGDRIRLETVEPADLQAALNLAEGVLPAEDSVSLAFFHLDSITLQPFNYAQLEQLFRQMRH